MNKGLTLRSRAISLALLALAPFTLGCASNAALRTALKDRDAELAREREEHAETYRRLQDALAGREDLEAQLAAARRQVVQPVAASAAHAESFPELDELGVGYGTRNGNMVITLPSEITFPSGKATLTARGRSALSAVAQRLRDEYGDARFYIEGHTDSDPIAKAKFSSNRDLSIARGMSVLKYLVEECQIPDERFVIVGHGQYEPVASNASAAGKARNRRVEIVVHRGEAKH